MYAQKSNANLATAWQQHLNENIFSLTKKAVCEYDVMITRTPTKLATLCVCVTKVVDVWQLDVILYYIKYEGESNNSSSTI